MDENDILPQVKLYKFDELAYLISEKLQLDRTSFLNSCRTSQMLKAEIFYDEMHQHSMESYFYVKVYIESMTEQMLQNFESWCRNVEKIPYVLYEEFTYSDLKKIEATKRELKIMMEMLLKLSDFQKRYFKSLKRNVKIGNTFNTVYKSITHKVQKIFKYEEKDIDLPMILDEFSKSFKFSSIIGITGNWLSLFTILYRYYGSFLESTDTVVFLLNATLKFDLDIDAMTEEVEKEIAAYNSWVQTIDPLKAKNGHKIDMSLPKAKTARKLLAYERILTKEIISTSTFSISSHSIASINPEAEQKYFKKIEDISVMEGNEKTLNSKRRISSLYYDQDFDFEFQLFKKLCTVDKEVFMI